MAVYVDALLPWGWVLRGRRVPSCHMIADTLDELHEFAAAIGMRRAWFQDKASTPHYDLTAARRIDAVARGALELDRQAFTALARRLRAERVAAALKQRLVEVQSDR